MNHTDDAKSNALLRRQLIVSLFSIQQAIATAEKALLLIKTEQRRLSEMIYGKGKRET